MKELYILENADVREINAQSLAFLGDAVFEVLVRQITLNKGNMPVNKLHIDSVRYVRAEAQAKAIENIFFELTDKEKSVFKRGRNATPNSIPKNADILEYKKATGLETLFGYLFIEKKFERINEIFSKIIHYIDN